MNADTITTLIPMIAVFVGVLATLGFTGYALRGVLPGGRRRLNARIDAVRQRSSGLASRESKKHSSTSVKREEAKGVAAVEAIIKKIMPRQDVLKSRLDRTGRKIAIGTYALTNIAALAVVTGAAWGVFGVSVGTAVALGLVAGLGIPHMAVSRMANKRIDKFNKIFPDAIDLIVRGLKSGLPVTESIAAVGAEMPDPVGIEFRRINDSVKLGQTLEEAMWEAASRLDTPEFKFFVISLSVQRETGGNLGETLANLSEILRGRKQMRLKIKAMSSEARASAMILGSLPLIMFAIIYVLNPDYEAVLFTDPRGKMMLGFAMTIMTVGVLVMRKMVRFEI